MHHYYTFLVLDLARERVDEASRERLAVEARGDRVDRPSLGDRLRAAARGLGLGSGDAAVPAPRREVSAPGH